jgi:two-component system cell cycle response regulator CpdR
VAKILLAEDDDDMRRFLVRVLERAGHDVTSF